MRGKAVCQSVTLFGMSPDYLVPGDHLICRIKPIVEQALEELSPTFTRMYAAAGHPSIRTWRTEAMTSSMSKGLPRCRWSRSLRASSQRCATNRERRDP